MSPDTEPVPTKAQIRRWRRYLAEERMEAATYAYLARSRTGEEREILEGLARAEKRHEAHWVEKLGLHAYPPPRAPIRSRMLAGFARFFGSIFALAMVQRAEARSAYVADLDATEQMAADERIHTEVVRALATRGRSKLSGSFRAALFGANDGLVSNLALVLGIIGTGASNTTVLATGVAGLLAGALSMAAGEYVSVRSQRELLEASTPDPRSHDAVARLDVNSNELALIFRARGDDPGTAEYKAQALFTQIQASRDSVEEDEVNSYEELGTALGAALSSFCFFAAGAIIPVLPFIFGATGVTGMLISLGVVGLALLATGGAAAVLAGASPVMRALRQLCIGYGAAGITYFLGWAFGTTIA